MDNLVKDINEIVLSNLSLRMLSLNILKDYEDNNHNIKESKVIKKYKSDIQRKAKISNIRVFDLECESDTLTFKTIILNPYNRLFFKYPDLLGYPNNLEIHSIPLLSFQSDCKFYKKENEVLKNFREETDKVEKNLIKKMIRQYVLYPLNFSKEIKQKLLDEQLLPLLENYSNFTGEYCDTLNEIKLNKFNFSLISLSKNEDILITFCRKSDNGLLTLLIPNEFYKDSDNFSHSNYLERLSKEEKNIKSKISNLTKKSESIENNKSILEKIIKKDK